MKFKVHIEETLSKDVIVDAETRQDARAMIEEKIENEEIVLSADDFTGCRKMNIKTTKTEYKDLLKVLEQSANFVTEKATRARELDMARRLTRSRLLLEKRNGSFEGESSDSH